eukprot:142921_1
MGASNSTVCNCTPFSDENKDDDQQKMKLINNTDAYVDNSVTPEQYYNKEAKRYASDKWVHIVAKSFAKKMADIRPFQKSDVLLDIGCGPGLTTLSVMNVEEKESNSIGSSVYMVDLSKEFIKIAQQNISDIPNKNIFIQQMDVFTKDKTKGDLSNTFQQLLSDKIKFVDCGWMSLVSEYLSPQQLITIATEVCKQLSVGGIFAFLDWGEHLPYGPIWGNKRDPVHWDRGISKKDWLEIAAEVVENIENGKRILIDEKENKKKASRSEYTLTVWNSTFELHLKKKKDR